MCKFFSGVSDGKGKFMYFDSKLRKECLSGKLNYEPELLLQECGMRWESINDEEKEYWVDKAKSLFDWLGGGE